MRKIDRKRTKFPLFTGNKTRQPLPLSKCHIIEQNEGAWGSFNSRRKLKFPHFLNWPIRSVSLFQPKTNQCRNRPRVSQSLPAISHAQKGRALESRMVDRRDCDAILDWMSKNAHVLPVPDSQKSDFTPTLTRLHDIGMSFVPDENLTPVQITGWTRAGITRCGMRFYCWFHGSEYRATRGNWSELLPELK